MKHRLIFLTISLLTILSCKEKKQLPHTGTTGQLIPIDRSDSNLSRIQPPEDTILKSGWALHFFIKDDSTRYEDLYIKWEKGNRSGLYKGEGFLSGKLTFVPEFSEEDERYIFMEHGNLLALSKQDFKGRDFEQVKAYDTSTNCILWFSSDNYVKEDTLQVTITDLNKQKDTTILFDNIAIAPFKEQYIDTVLFDKNSVTIKCTLVDKYDRKREKEVEEVKKVVFNMP